jgi:hypothetical protein
MKVALPYTMPAEVRRLLWLIGVSGLVAMGIVWMAILVSRISTSAATASPWLLPSAGFLAVGFIVALRELATLPLAADDPRRAVLAGLASVTLLLTLAAAWVPPTSVALVVILAIVIVGEEAAAWWLLRRGGGAFLPAGRENLSAASDVPCPALPMERTGAALQPDGEEAEVEEAEDEQMLPADVLQQLTRSRSESGGEIIYGLLRAEFTVGQRQEWLSVAFCPPLASRPQCTAHFADGTSGVLEVEEVETYGVRLMIRLPQPVAAKQSLLVELFAEGK